VFALDSTDDRLDFRSFRYRNAVLASPVNFPRIPFTTRRAAEYNTRVHLSSVWDQSSRMVRHARLRLFPASTATTAWCLGLMAVLCLAVMPALPVHASAATYAPVASYSFDQDPGEGTTIEDASGDGHTATIHGASWTEHGRYGGAMEFDAEAHDYLS